MLNPVTPENHRYSINCRESRTFDPYTPSTCTLGFGIIILIFEIATGFIDIDRTIKYVKSEVKCQSVSNWLNFTYFIDFGIPIVTLCYVSMNRHIILFALCLFQSPLFIIVIWYAILEITIKLNPDSVINKQCFDLLVSYDQNNIWACAFANYLIAVMVIVIYCTFGILQ